MKKLTYLLTAGVLVAFFAISGCKKKDDPGISTEDQAGNNYIGTWVVNGSEADQVTFNSTEDRTSSYSDFTMTVNYTAGAGEGTLDISGGDVGSSPWKQGITTWKFDGEVSSANQFNIIRTTDQLKIGVLLTETTATLTFKLEPGNDTGRTQAVEGNWSFILEKQ